MCFLSLNFILTSASNLNNPYPYFIFVISLAKDLYFLQNAEGAGLAPFDCWICLRGIKTMALRVEKQQENAQKIAEFLLMHPRVKKVNYAGLPDHPGRALHYLQVLTLNGTSTFLEHLQIHTGNSNLLSIPCRLRELGLYLAF